MSSEKDIEKVKQAMQECPVCESAIDAIEHAACTLITSKTGVDYETCRRALRSRLEGRSIEDIARELKLEPEELQEIMNLVITEAEKIWTEMGVIPKKGKRKE